MASSDIRILAEPLTSNSCRFTVDRPVHADASFYFPDKERATDSPLASRIFAIEGVSSVLIAHDQVTVTKSGADDWQVVGRKVGAAIREHLATGLPAVPESLRATLPPPEEIRRRVEDLLETEVNPGVAGHGGFVRLVDVRGNDVFIQMGGGCQGCGMAALTLKYGVEAAIRRRVPEVGGIYDATDHASGRNPYFASSEG